MKLLVPTLALLVTSVLTIAFKFGQEGIAPDARSTFTVTALSTLAEPPVRKATSSSTPPGVQKSNIPPLENLIIGMEQASKNGDTCVCFGDECIYFISEDAKAGAIERKITHQVQASHPSLRRKAFSDITVRGSLATDGAIKIDYQGLHGPVSFLITLCKTYIPQHEGQAANSTPLEDQTTIGTLLEIETSNIVQTNSASQHILETNDLSKARVISEDGHWHIHLSPDDVCRVKIGMHGIILVVFSTIGYLVCGKLQGGIVGFNLYLALGVYLKSENVF